MKKILLKKTFEKVYRSEFFPIVLGCLVMLLVDTIFVVVGLARIGHWW